ncbi:MAG TPA: LysM peptidoglycan-binding domain-containing protein [Solirubrobacteraceae bacterium]|jgi:LysM repeat protein|nr:LysM peptidoglycan-binding domain-containing protein [Solirubrobacteraceae bacterium]
MRLTVLIPVTVATMLAAPTGASAAFPHVVVPGESLSSVAESDGLTIDQLSAANGISPEASLTAGSTLMIPSQEAGPEESAASAGEGASSSGEPTSSGSESASTTEATSSAASYVVQPGDTLSAIAAQSGMTVGELAATNGIDPNATLLSGAVIRVSGSSTEAAQPTETTAEASGGPPYATEESVSPSEVGSIAAENGVPPSLAEAIAEQESGFNNRVVSGADARGVMQILPGTWNWIDSELAGSEHLAPASATANVRAGVLLLRSLLSETGGDAGLAAAGYYQGLSSVLQNGEEPETEQYVASVLALQRRFAGE